jgi:hypothetical protein
MSMFFPFGVFNKEIIDPEILGDEFQEALRTAFATTHYQWKGQAMEGTTDDVLGGIDALEVSKLCNVHVKRVAASFQRAHGDTQHLAADDGSTPASGEDSSHDIEKDPNTWLIPYNRGFHSIGDGDVSVGWTSEYPELVLSCFSFQYARWRTDFTNKYGYWENFTEAKHKLGEWFAFVDGFQADVNAVRPRVQVRLEVDGARIPGTGPWASGVSEQYRGQGLVGGGMLRTTVFSCNSLPAGDHVVTPVAAQASAVLGNDTAQIHFDKPPSDGVAICQRSNTVIRLAMGGHLGT